MDKFINKVVKFIRDNQLILRGDAVTVGFSGGADSVCLLAALHEVKHLLGIELQAVHVNHNLRGEEAKRDEAFCRAFAAEHEIPFIAANVQVRELVAQAGLTEEEAGRILRYQVLQENAEAFAAEKNCPRAVIAVAHHADDQAETILMNLLRGSGLKGLGGMQAARDNIVRPLLALGRSDILQFLEKRALSYMEDSTNLENEHTRNRLRNIIIPELKTSVNCRAVEHIVESGNFAREADAYLEAEAERYLAQYSAQFTENDRIARKLGQTELKEKAPIFRRYVIIKALKELGIPLKDWGEKHFHDIDKALFGSKGYHVDLPGGVYVENIYKETLLYMCTKRDVLKEE